tara:strand:+ start:246 stop:485 length:240 start_codon:yes stop_codon:yes gene_type:complete
MKLKIVSEGTGPTTQVVNAETGEVVENVMGLEISMDAFTLEAAILIRDPELSIDNIEVQEVRQGDPTGNVGTAGNPNYK